MERSVGQEHFASNVIGGRLRTLARGWGDGDGQRALLACPPGEQHELGLLCFGLLLRERGWRIAYLGAETPTSDLATAIAELSPELVVLGAMGAQRFLDAADGIRALNARRASRSAARARRRPSPGRWGRSCSPTTWSPRLVR